LDRVHRLEMGHEIVRDDADKTWSQATLRHKGVRRACAQHLDLLGDLDVLREVEVVQLMFQREASDRGITKVWEAGEHRLKSVRGQIGTDGVSVSNVEQD